MTAQTQAPTENAARGWRFRVGQYLSLVRFSHTVFALPFALLAGLLAWQTVPFRWQALLGILVCMIAARTAAMAFNRLADHQLDAANPRTAGRHLPAGILSRREVIGLTLVSSLVFVAGTLLFLPNWLPLALAVPVLAWLCGYSFAKRFTSLAHYWLGIALGLSPLAAWIAITGAVETPAIWLMLVVIAWVGGFDILYACQDEEYDRSVKLHSVPARVGRRRAFWIARFSHLVAVVALIGVWQSAALGWVFAAGVAAIAILLVVEHCLVSPDDLSRVNAAFFTVNAVISFGVLIITAADVMLTV